MSTEPGLNIYYDGECPLCCRFACALDQNTQLTFIDVRVNADAREMLNKHGFDLDAGMVVQDQDKLLHGSEAVKHMSRQDSLDLYLGGLGKFPLRLIGKLSCSYPMLKMLRRLLLWWKNIPLINDEPPKAKRTSD